MAASVESPASLSLSEPVSQRSANGSRETRAEGEVVKRLLPVAPAPAPSGSSSLSQPGWLRAAMPA